jgi:ABC-type polar amino acid transport system ATPase subunit
MGNSRNGRSHEFIYMSGIDNILLGPIKVQKKKKEEVIKEAT